MLDVIVDPPDETGTVAIITDNPRFWGVVFWLVVIAILWSRPVIRYGLIGAGVFALIMLVMNGGSRA